MDVSLIGIIQCIDLPIALRRRQKSCLQVMYSLLAFSLWWKSQIYFSWAKSKQRIHMFQIYWNWGQGSISCLSETLHLWHPKQSKWLFYSKIWFLRKLGKILNIFHLQDKMLLWILVLLHWIQEYAQPIDLLFDFIQFSLKSDMYIMLSTIKVLIFVLTIEFVFSLKCYECPGHKCKSEFVLDQEIVDCKGVCVLSTQHHLRYCSEDKLESFKLKVCIQNL